MQENRGVPASALRFRLKFRQLVLLDALGETGSLRQAAQRSNLTQPAATRSLSEVEAAFGAPLFDRSHKGMVPTVYGLALIRHARRLLLDVEKAREEILHLKSGSHGNVRIASLMPLMSELVPRALGMVKQRHPYMHISLEQLAQNPMVAQLHSGSVDIALCRIIPEQGDIEQTILFDDKHIVVAGKNYPAACAGQVALGDLVDQPWVLPPSGGPLHAKLSAMFLTQAGRLPLNTIESTSLGSNLTLIEEFGFVSVMTEGMADFYARQGRIRKLPIELGNLLGPIVVALRRDEFRAPAVDIVCHEIVKQANAFSARGSAVCAA